ncbi:MAG: hypothetical protein MUF45_09360 [Spirosomaceae bacterium]|jgi:hypothetical protein|nr:hypothetical protein [Spirosomataceae bacterium]
MNNPTSKNNQVELAKKTITRKVNKNLKEAVVFSEQQKEIELMKELIPHEKFFFVVSTEGIIEHINGVERWLGYNEEVFNLEKYLNIIHPSYLEFLIHLAEVTFNIANNIDFRVGFREQRYVVDVAIKHADGHYVLCKRALSAWQWRFDNQKQQITHYFNEFTITNPLIEEINPNLYPRILDSKGVKLFDLEALLKRNAAVYLEDNKIFFSIQEIRILRKLSYNPKMTTKDLAAAFKNKVGTINTLNKRIIKKGRLLFNNEEINTAKSVAIMMRKNFLI